MASSYPNTATAKRSTTPITMATSQVTRPLNLLDFPVEIVLLLIETLNSDPWPHNHKHVRAFRLTCRTIYALCETYFCRFLHIADGYQGSNLDLMLKTQPERASLIKTVAIYPRWTVPDHRQLRYREMVRFVPRLCSTLEVLHILCIGFNEGDLFEELNPQFRGLVFANLRECTLVSYSIPTPVNHVLKAPNLHTLKVSMPVLDPDEPLPPPRSTALRHLALYEARWDDTALFSAVLEVPAALQSLEFETKEVKDREHEYGTLNKLVSVLARHQPRLERFKVYTNEPYTYAPARAAGLLNLAPLAALKELEFALVPNVPRNCFVNLPRGLEILRLHGPVSLKSLALALTRMPADVQVAVPPRVEIHARYGWAWDAISSPHATASRCPRPRANTGTASASARASTTS
ncbi:hypothetical protein CLAIMM_14956 [Cladophialophora immunda]|nr:hypothetical protein CLAIMM_14956 [Cladophialophora immunda]